MIDVVQADKLNELQIIQVMDDLAERGIKNATLRPGNDCIWVSYGRIDCYYIFRDGKIVDIQVD